MATKKCKDCRGRGKCKYCKDGNAKKRNPHPQPGRVKGEWVDCHVCGGSGDCQDCGGRGYVDA